MANCQGFVKNDVDLAGVFTAVTAGSGEQAKKTHASAWVGVITGSHCRSGVVFTPINTSGTAILALIDRAETAGKRNRIRGSATRCEYPSRLAYTLIFLRFI